MTLTELKYITAVARTKHFGQAAQDCFVSQPTLSVAIRKLEEELAVTIFERNRTEVTITPLGERLVEQARKVLESAEELKNIVSEQSDQCGTPLKLGVIYTIGPYLLPHLIPSFKSHRAEYAFVDQRRLYRCISGTIARGQNRRCDLVLAL